MLHAMEVHGRLHRRDGAPAEPGEYDLRFALHAARDGGAPLWEDEVRAVRVGTGGYYHAVVGVGNALRPQLFGEGARWLSVREVRDGRVDVERTERMPCLGRLVAVAEELRDLHARVEALEADRGPDPRVTRGIRGLRRRWRRLEAGEGPLAPLLARIAHLEARVARLDGADGRVARIEDELEDIVGPDGDIVDLSDRMAAVEKARARTAR